MSESARPALLRVVFVCTGNVCRSPFAERLATARTRAGDVLRFESAGSAALVGAPIDPLMAHELARRGADAQRHRARQVTDPMLADADLVITMTAAQRDTLVRDHPSARRAVFTLSQLDQVAGDLPEDDDLLSAIRARAPRARATDDVPDPYRRGAHAMAAAARRIEKLLDRLLPAELSALEREHASGVLDAATARDQALHLLGRG